MQAILARLSYLFGSTRGLVLVAIALISLVTAIFGTLSGPMAEWGIKDFTVRVLGMQLLESEREGRIIMLYHAIANAVVAIEVYFITAILPMKGHQRTTINGTITVGYILAMVFGLAFGYWGHNFIFHGLFIFGLSLVFFAGMMLVQALWPWRPEYRISHPNYAHLGGIDLERMAFFVMALATLGSAALGGAAGANFGNGFKAFLAEDVVRELDKTPLELAIIGHLHIMLTLVAVALALIVGRWLDFQGKLHKVAMPLMIAGTVLVTLGAWGVVPFEAVAHNLIYAGSVPMLTAALLLVAYGWRKLTRERLLAQGIRKASFVQKLRALVHDPLKFGALWQMVYMNFVVTFVGIFMAIELDKVVRKWPWRDERIILTGHWHILSGIIATIILLYYGDIIGLKGRTRRLFGWAVILCSDLAFAAVTLFSIKRLFVSETDQQPVVNVTMLLGDIGLALVLVALAGLMVWRLVDLFKRNGRWSKEMDDFDPIQEAEMLAVGKGRRVRR